MKPLKLVAIFLISLVLLRQVAASSSIVQIEVYSADGDNERKGGGFVLDGVYAPDSEVELLALKGLVELVTFSKAGDVHPWVGIPKYLVFTIDGKQHGRVLLFYSGADVGFYLLDDVVRKEDGLSGAIDYGKLRPVSSQSLCILLQRVVDKSGKVNRTEPTKAR